MKKCLSMLLVLAALVSCLSTVSAAEIQSEKIDYIVETSTRGTSEPKKVWDWDDGNYVGSFSGVMQGVYTNYYFTNVTDLSVRFYQLLATPKNEEDGNDARMLYSLVDLTDPDATTELRWGPLVTEDEEKMWEDYFYNLDSTHKYCIRIRTNGGFVPIKGKLTVSTSF